MYVCMYVCMGEEEEKLLGTDERAQPTLYKCFLSGSRYPFFFICMDSH